MKKLLYIGSDSDKSIDEVLMIVPENYDKEEALQRAEEAGVELPFIEKVIELDDESNLPADWRVYVG